MLLPVQTRWMRLVYAHFEDFKRDQERLISLPEDESFDFVLANNDDPINGWHSVPLSTDVAFDATLIPSNASSVLYCLEVALNYRNASNVIAINKKTESLIASLSFIKGLNYSLDLSYFDFLNRVHGAEVEARSTGAWDAPHPWLNLFIPRSKIVEFDSKVFKRILKHGVGGPMLLYPVNKNKYLIASHTTDYQNPWLLLNTIAVLVLVIAKFPNMHKVRIFGINADYPM